MKRAILALLLMAVTLSAFPDKKNRDWKQGKLLDISQGVRSNGVPSGRYTLQIQGDDYIYVVSYVTAWRWSKEAELTINAPVKYAIEKHTFYLLDEKDREFKMGIEKKILREK